MKSQPTLLLSGNSFPSTVYKNVKFWICVKLEETVYGIVDVQQLYALNGQGQIVYVDIVDCADLNSECIYFHPHSFNLYPSIILADLMSVDRL